MQASIEPSTSASSIPLIPASASKPPEPRNRDLALKRAIYTEAIKAGCKNAEASRRAGINPNTGVRWHREMRNQASELPSKDAIVASLFREYTKADTPYKANLAKRIFEAMGFAMRAQSDDTNRAPSKPLRELVVSWWAETHRQSAPRIVNAQCDNSMSDNGRYVALSVPDAVTASRAGDSASGGADEAKAEGGGSPQPSASGGVRSDSQTAPGAEKVSTPGAAENGKSVLAADGERAASQADGTR